MNETLIVGAILVVAWVGLLLLRVPSSIAFLSLLIGQLLSTEASSDLYEIIAGIVAIPELRYVQIALLLLPLVITIGLMRNRVSKSKRTIELVPSLFVAALTLVLLAPLLMPLQNLLDTVTNDQWTTYKSIIVIAAAASGLVSAYLSYPKPVKVDKHAK